MKRAQSQASQTSKPARLRFLVIFLLLIALSLFFLPKFFPKSFLGEPEVVPSPEEYSVPFWDEILGGDQAFTENTWAELSDLSKSDLTIDKEKAVSIAKEVLLAERAGIGREKFSSYFTPSGFPDAPCKDVSVLAASPMKFPAPGSWAKVLVAYKGNCSDSLEAKEGTVTSVFLTRSSGQVSPEQKNSSTENPEQNDLPTNSEQGASAWVPVRVWAVPGSNVLSDPTASRAPAEYELKRLSACGAPTNASFKMRILPANAWDLLCADAARSKISLKVLEAYRTPKEQKDLFDKALKRYKNEKTARQQVAFSDGERCLSRHCSGVAMDIESGPGLSWLKETVGCDNQGVITPGNTCTAGTPISRMARFGFASTLPQNPEHLEFTLPIPDETEQFGIDCQPSGLSVPEEVAAIFRCRLSSAGLPEDQIKKVTAEAVVVSRCASGWNPEALRLQGRFQSEPDPTTGETYTDAGVFLLPSSYKDWIPGGLEKIRDPLANIHAAASLYLADRNWSSFGCATGDSAGFGSGPVLPQHNGPVLPDWSYTY